MAADMLPLKRQRDGALIDGEEAAEVEGKRQKSYEDILSLLEEEEEVPTQDLSFLITNLQQELSSEPGPDLLACPASSEADLDPPSSSSSSSSSPEVEEEERERIIRHLLEASDDELGLPVPVKEEGSSEAWSGDGGACGDDDAERGGEGLDLCEGLLWELEDDAANYYAFLQSQLFD